MIRLVITSGGDKGRTYEVAADGETVIGRVSECGVHIPDGRISRRHCVISAGQAGYTVKDLKSSNGTFVNGKRVTEAALKDGDRLKVGVIEMEFRIAERIEDGKTELLGSAGRPPPEQVPARPSRCVPARPLRRARPLRPAPAQLTRRGPAWLLLPAQVRSPRPGRAQPLRPARAGPARRAPAWQLRLAPAQPPRRVRAGPVRRASAWQLRLARARLP